MLVEETTQLSEIDLDDLADGLRFCGYTARENFVRKVNEGLERAEQAGFKDEIVAACAIPDALTRIHKLIGLSLRVPPTEVNRNG